MKIETRIRIPTWRTFVFRNRK